MAGVWKQKADNSKGSGEGFELIAEGDYPAVLVAIIDLGHQLTKKFKSEEVEWVRKLFFVWELVGQKSRPLPWKDFRLFNTPGSTLRQFVETWRGKKYADGEDIDYSKFLSRPCILGIKHRKSKDGQKTFHEVDSASRPLDEEGNKIEVPKAEHTPLLWSVEDGTLKQLPEWLPRLYGNEIAEVVAECKEWKDKDEDDAFDPDEKTEEEAVPAKKEEDIPF